ncbi:MAG: hypothetical protein JW934_22565 [Anaerolineae bacterium]|nr:hypothetical protein [Anaerolineae bacterium]
MEMIHSLHGYVPPRLDSESLRTWWHQILGNYGKYNCYGIILGLPSDVEAISYLKDFGKELNLISGDNCLIIFLTKTGFQRCGFDNEIYSLAVNEHISDGYSIQIAKLFDISFDEFPCMLFFSDIRSSNHVIASLKDMSVDDIAQSMRSIFSVIEKAINQNQDPVKLIEYHRNSQEFLKKGKSFVSELRSIANKTFETAIEAWIKVNIK